MVQNDDKLREVGLEPDKPAGYVRAIWALTLILAFVIIILGGVYFILWYSPWGENALWHRVGIANETKDWQTYTNSSYKISVKYPKDWQYAEFSDSSNSKVSVSFYNKDLSTDIERIKQHPETEFLFDVGLVMRQGDKKSEYSAESSCQKQSDTKIDGVSGEIYKCHNEMNDEDIFNYVVVNNDKTYVLMSNQENKIILNKMVGTFSFSSTTKSATPKSSTKNKTYTNQDLVKFSFDYPEKFYLFPDFQEYGGTIKLLRKDESSNTMTWTRVEINVNYLASKTTDIRVAYKEINKSDLPEGGISKVEETTIDGVPALKQTYTDLGDIGYFLIKNDYLIEISAYTSRIGDEKSVFSDSDVKAGFETIVSSFKFI